MGLLKEFDDWLVNELDGEGGEYFSAKNTGKIGRWYIQLERADARPGDKNYVRVFERLEDLKWTLIHEEGFDNFAEARETYRDLFTSEGIEEFIKG